MFTTNPQDLRNLLEDAANGELQLPDFQRSYVWADSDVRGVLASLAMGFPVGSLLTLETGGVVRFAPRLIEGSNGTRKPRTLLLDGQQRITSLFQALYTKDPVRTKNVQGNIVERHYFLDMQALVENGADLVDAIEWTPANRIRPIHYGGGKALDLSTRETQIASHMFPLDEVFDAEDWWFEWRSYWEKSHDELRQAARPILDNIKTYKLPVISLDRENSREAVCLVFEKVNVGGKKLDAFELLTAMLATEEFDLRRDWEARRQRLFAPTDLRYLVLKGDQPYREVQSTDFLQAVSFLATRDRRITAERNGIEGRRLPQISVKRGELLNLSYANYDRFADGVEEGFKSAAAFVNDCGVYFARDLPYPSQRVVLAALSAARDNKAPSQPEAAKLTQWFWCVALGELYGSSTETRVARDTQGLLDWLDGGDPPRSISEATFRVGRFEELQTRNSAAYKAIHSLMLQAGCRDFRTGKKVSSMTLHSDPIDVHHVFPAAWCERAGFDKRLWNSILNKTPILASTNRSIKDHSPADYLIMIQQNDGLTKDQIDEILTSHMIDPDALRANDFELFIKKRRRALASVVKAAMGKGLIETEHSEPTEVVYASAEDGDELEGAA